MNRKQRKALEKKQEKQDAYSHQNKEDELATVVYQKALVAKADGNIQGAKALLKKIVEIKKDYLPAVEQLAVIAYEAGDIEEALSGFLKVLEINGDHYDSLKNSGICLMELEDFDQSLKYLSRALDIKDTADVHNAIAMLYRYKGLMDKALEHAQKSYTLEPNDFDFFYTYAQLYKYKSETDEVFLRLKQHEDRSCVYELERRARLYYLLFNAYEELGQPVQAFDYAIKMSECCIENWGRLDIAASEKFALEIKRFFSAEFFDANCIQGNRSEAPVFIVGMPRSGTTLVEQILQSHSEIIAIGEDSTLADMIFRYSQEEYNGKLTPFRRNKSNDEVLTSNQIAEKYLEYLATKLKSSKNVVNKAISNYLIAGYILLAFPKAKIIHVQRDPVDCGISAYVQLFNQGAHSYTYDLKDWAVFYNNYFGLMKHWNDLFPDNILNINYEDIVSDLEGSARKVITYIGCEWEDACLEFYNSKRAVTTASVNQVRKPIYKTSIGRWKRYGPKVAPLIRALGDSAPQEAITYLKELEK